MRKKIIFMLINMNIGGTEKALLNMINEIPKDKYDITIFMLEKYGGFLEFIPSNVNVKYFNGYQSIKDILNNPPQLMSLHLIKKGKIIKAITIMILHVITKILKNRSLFFRYTLNNYPVLEEEYDYALAYDGPMDFISYFILKKIKAKKKFQWIHFDVTKIGFNPRFASKVYSQYDKVFVVSKEARTKLIELVPNLQAKVDTFLNATSPQLIMSQAKEGLGFTDQFDGLRILTVGRLSTEKGQDIAIQVLARLIKNGYKVRWYCVGEGNARGEYEKLIKKFNLGDTFILLGSNPNPYPFMDQCDIYVQPSRHEGYCITLMEARYLNKPIITTSFTGAKEQINHGENGLIVGSNEDEIYHSLVELINNNELRNKLSENLTKEKFERRLETDKIFDCVG
ncbi:glycosyltransferase [Bacillus sp. JJ1521]|uniref:glycosyltransferase n=1 Tax=Bacillus sp. JJ1521 TaxID=3122957 RepID=UPI002FFDE535